MELNSEESFSHIFMQLAHAHFIRTNTYFEKLGIHPGQSKLLFILKKTNGISQREIADKLEVKASTIAVMIKRMEKTELIERKEDENDQRISRIFITNKGLEICDQVTEIIEKMEKECFLNFTSEEKIVVRRLLIHMRDNLRLVNKDKDKVKFGCDKNCL